MRKAFINTLTDMARKDSNIMLVTGDLGFSVFEDFQKELPGQFFNAGLCEQSMIGMAAGLAMEGKKVVVYSIIPFITHRAAEQVRNDLCYQKVPVTLVGVGSGFCYGALGGTHHAIDDVAVMTSLPGLKVYSPASPSETSVVLKNALSCDAPCYVRLNRAGDPEIYAKPETPGQQFIDGIPIRVAGKGDDIAVFATGSISTVALDVVHQLNDSGTGAVLYSVPTLKPMITESFVKIISQVKAVACIEELVERNGLGAAVSRIMIEQGVAKPSVLASLPDEFTHTVGSQSFLRAQYGLSAEQIIKRINAILLECSRS